MKIALIAVVALTLSSCSRQSAEPLPTTPDPPVLVPPLPPAPTTPRTFVWVVVIEKGGAGACIPGATVEIVRGQGLGRSVTQTTRGCSYWDPDYDAIFNGLNEGQELTLRSSAAGYAAKEITVIPRSGPQTAVTFELFRMQ